MFLVSLSRHGEDDDGSRLPDVQARIKLWNEERARACKFEKASEGGC